jgi:hypothetical protein
MSAAPQIRTELLENLKELHLQGPDDHGGSDRPTGPPLGHRGAEHPQLPDGAGQKDPGPGVGQQRSQLTGAETGVRCCGQALRSARNSNISDTERRINRNK